MEGYAADGVPAVALRQRVPAVGGGPCLTIRGTPPFEPTFSLSQSASIGGSPGAFTALLLGGNKSFKASIDVRWAATDMGLPLFLSMRCAATALRKLVDHGRAYPERLTGLAL